MPLARTLVMRTGRLGRFVLSVVNRLLAGPMVFGNVGTVGVPGLYRQMRLTLHSDMPLMLWCRPCRMARVRAGTTL